MLYSDLTGKILEACFEVGNELGAGFVEQVYENALLIALREKGLFAKSQTPLAVNFRGQVVGEFFVDVLVENKILLELKAVSALAKEHYAQTINYLKATNIEVGMLINFGNAKIEYRRFENKFLSTASNKNLLDNLLNG